MVARHPAGEGWKPRLRRGVVLAPAAGGRWQARWGFDGITFLEGPACERVLPWLATRLDGEHSIAFLRGLAGGRCNAGEVDETLSLLEEQGFLLLDARREPRGGAEAWLEAAAPNPLGVHDRLRAAGAIVFGRSRVAELTARAIEEQGVGGVRLQSRGLVIEGSEASRDGSSAIPVVVEPDWRAAELEAFNLAMLAASRRWLLAGAWNDRVLVGPFFVPGETACHACYRMRLGSHRKQLAAYRALEEWGLVQDAPPAPSEPLPGVAALAASWAALEVFHDLSGLAPPRTVGRVLVYYPRDARLMFETVLRVPWCPACERRPAGGE